MTKNELQDYLSRTSPTESKDLIETTACFLRAGKGTGKGIEENEFSKQEETKRLISFADENNLWFTSDISLQYFAEGAEQKVYLSANGKTVIKFNDSIFYSYWLDYFNSLSLHNLFFPSTAYTLLGFNIKNDILFAVVEQNFIIITEPTNLTNVKILLNVNGFEVKKNNDYYNKNLGIILEDLHDENVLTNNGILFFVDTVFYLDKLFFT